jgi:ABC-type proline/glycine betaine transport system permease subunit
VRLNARAEIDKVAFADVAREFLGSGTQARRNLWSAMFAPDFGRLLLEHLGLVFGSLALAVLVGIPLGLLAAKYSWLAQPVLASTGLLQTIPSLALLAFLIPFTGTIGAWPALIALFLYALLQITRNTYTGVMEVPRGLVQAGTALGLTPQTVLRKVEMPLAMPVILAGVKTSAVISVGTATIAAFIGANAPASFVAHFTVFVLACFIGYMVIWNVTPALHTPLMSVTNAISSIIAIGALVQVAPFEQSAVDRPTGWIIGLAVVSIALVAINMFGGFAVTQRMLQMFRK